MFWRYILTVGHSDNTCKSWDMQPALRLAQYVELVPVGLRAKFFDLLPTILSHFAFFRRATRLSSCQYRSLSVARTGW